MENNEKTSSGWEFGAKDEKREKKKKIVVFSGAGLDAESGIQTFRGDSGMWEEYNVMDVASISGWHKNRQLVLDFYNKRRKEFDSVKPNDAHYLLETLEDNFDVYHITQNVSDLLERAMCSNIIHLHGELTKMRAWDSGTVYDWPDGFELKIDSVDEHGDLLRPHVVWFGESVPMMLEAQKICKKADILVIVGSSMQVYPAASIVNLVPSGTPIFVIDPNNVNTDFYDDITHIKEVATKGVYELIKILKNSK